MHTLHSSEKNSSALSTKKALGTVQKVQSLIEQDAYCPDIIQQIDAAIGLLNSTKKTLLAGHLKHCLADRIHQDEEQTISELLKIYGISKK